MDADVGGWTAGMTAAGLKRAQGSAWLLPAAAAAAAGLAAVSGCAMRVESAAVSGCAVWVEFAAVRGCAAVKEYAAVAGSAAVVMP